MSKTLTEYEEGVVTEIAMWKAETPSGVGRVIGVLRKPLNAVIGRVVPGSVVGSVCSRIESVVDPKAGRDEIARAAGVRKVEELAQHSLEDCDRLAEDVSVHAQRGAILESAAAGAAGIVGAAVSVPVLVGAAIRAIRRIGHCYGYPLATERDRYHVLGVLELATADDAETRQKIRARLDLLMHDPKTAPLELVGLRRELAEDLMFEAVPFLGEVATLVLDYAFMRRVDIAARRVFQERWLRRRGKVLVIPPAESVPVSRSFPVVLEASREVLYLGSFGLAYVATVPVAAAGAVLKGALPATVVQGATDGARDAGAAVDRLREGVRGTPAVPAAQAVV